MNKIIEVANLKKSYGDVQAVKGIDFYVEEGSLFAFLGENGAGKSTTISVLCTLLRADSGDIRINGYEGGKDDGKIRDQIGVVFQDSMLDPGLSVEDNLKIRGGLYGFTGSTLKRRVKKAAKAAEVEVFLKRPYGKLSGGQRRRVDIARALVHTPKILFLDEPTTGLDPATRKTVWQTIRKLQKEENMTVFLTTHYMEEAADADYVTVMGGGRILAKGTPLELRQEFCSDLLRIKPSVRENVIGMLEGMDIDYTEHENYIQIFLKRTTDAIPYLEKIKEDVDNVEIINGTMDNVFLNIIQERGIGA